MKKIHLLIGILISAIFLYFAFKEADFVKVVEGLNNVDFIYLIPILFIVVWQPFLRSVRWGIMLSPITKISQKKLFPITCVGLMVSVIFPLRTGEIARPYLVSEETQIPLTSSIAIIFLERVLDLFAISGVLLCTIFFSELPHWIVQSSYVLILLFFILIVLMALLYFKTNLVLQFLSPIFRLFPKQWEKKIKKSITTFVEGLQIISNPKNFIYTIFLSFLIWISAGLLIYSLLYFHQFQLPLISAFTVLVITMLGIAIPGAPGVLGNFQYACIVSLALFNIPKNDAILFSITYYFFAILVSVLVGLIFLPVVRFSLTDLFARLKDKTKAIRQ